MALLHVNGIEQWFEWHGKDAAGVPVALVAGMGGASTYWGPQIQSISSRYRTLVYDQRGTGKSSRTPVASIEQLADDFIAMLDLLEVDKVHLVGHSTGGAIGQVVAVRYPNRLASLVLYASIHRADDYRHRIWGLRKSILEHMGPEVYAQTTSLFFYTPEYINRHHKELLEVEARTASTELTTPEVMVSRIDAILRFDVSGQLAQIVVPTLVVCARDDLLTPAYFSESIAQAIPGSELVLLDRGGHAYSRSHPEAFNDLLTSFLVKQISANAA